MVGLPQTQGNPQTWRPKNTLAIQRLLNFHREPIRETVDTRLHIQLDSAVEQDLASTGREPKARYPGAKEAQRLLLTGFVVPKSPPRQRETTDSMFRNCPMEGLPAGKSSSRILLSVSMSAEPPFFSRTYHEAFKPFKGLSHVPMSFSFHPSRCPL